MLISCAASLAAIWTLGGAELRSNRSLLSIGPYFWEIQVSQSELSGSMFRGIAVTAARRLRVSEEPKSRPSAVADGLGLGLPKPSPFALTDAASASSVMVGEQPHPLILLPLDSHSPNSRKSQNVERTSSSYYPFDAQKGGVLHSSQAWERSLRPIYLVPLQGLWLLRAEDSFD
jgi:hypothetical protein